jgi:hypothetical protein
MRGGCRSNGSGAKQTASRGSSDGLPGADRAVSVCRSGEALSPPGTPTGGVWFVSRGTPIVDGAPLTSPDLALAFNQAAGPRHHEKIRYERARKPLRNWC